MVEKVVLQNCSIQSMYIQTFISISAKFLEEFATQNYQYFVNKSTDGQTQRKAESSMSPKPFVLQGYKSTVDTR